MSKILKFLSYSALPTELSSHMVGEEGLEPSRSCLHRILSPVCLLFHHSPLSGCRGWIRTSEITGSKPVGLPLAHSAIWQGHKDLNLDRRFWRPISYHWTMPLYKVSLQFNFGFSHLSAPLLSTWAFGSSAN